MRNLYQIREVSTLSFNERVLQEAEDRRNPLLERLKFLGIFSSNMDEFFKVRVASIHRRLELGKKGLQEVLESINEKAYDLDDRFQKAYRSITRGLAKEGINILTEQDLERQKPELVTWVRNYFRRDVLTSIVPLIIHENNPFPQLIDGSLYFGVEMKGLRSIYAVVEVPAEHPRFVVLPTGNIMYIDDVIRFCLDDIFYIFEYDQIGAWEFKISRDAELDIDNDFSEGYVRKMRKVLEQRKGGRPTRIVFDAAVPDGLRAVLLHGLQIGEEDTLIMGGRYHNMKDLMRFPIKRPDLMFESMEPARHPVLDRGRAPMMQTIAGQDLLLTYPYQSFDHVIRLLREAAIDPEVEEIRMTLYRAARRSQVVNALANAARNGKRVFVNIELQARFDEKNNIKISEFLGEQGVTVVYGVPPMKVHSKLLLIRRKGKLYCGLSTGNYNEVTARLYVDSLLLTAEKRLCQEAEGVFDFLEQAARMPAFQQPKFKHLLVSPFNYRKTILKLIEREAKKGKDGYIMLKVNHLTDDKVVAALVAAAAAGVKMDLLVRTTYGLGSHKNIRAISILDRYLEHQRILLFGRGDDQKVYMSSADLMERNLDWRVEVGFPVLDPQLREEIRGMVACQLADNRKARILDDTQSNAYVSNRRGRRRAQYATHEYFEDLYIKSQAR